MENKLTALVDMLKNDTTNGVMEYFENGAQTGKRKNSRDQISIRLERNAGMKINSFINAQKMDKKVTISDVDVTVVEGAAVIILRLRKNVPPRTVSVQTQRLLSECTVYNPTNPMLSNSLTMKVFYNLFLKNFLENISWNVACGSFKILGGDAIVLFAEIPQITKTLVDEFNHQTESINKIEITKAMSQVKPELKEGEELFEIEKTDIVVRTFGRGNNSILGATAVFSSKDNSSIISTNNSFPHVKQVISHNIKGNLGFSIKTDGKKFREVIKGVNTMGVLEDLFNGDLLKMANFPFQPLLTEFTLNWNIAYDKNDEDNVFFLMEDSSLDAMQKLVDTNEEYKFVVTDGVVSPLSEVSENSTNYIESIMKNKEGVYALIPKSSDAKSITYRKFFSNLDKGCNPLTDAGNLNELVEKFYNSSLKIKNNYIEYVNVNFSPIQGIIEIVNVESIKEKEVEVEKVSKEELDKMNSEKDRLFDEISSLNSKVDKLIEMISIMNKQ